EDVPRYKVLSAGKVMRPVSGAANDNDPIPAHAKIESLIDRMADSDEACCVANDDGEIVGEIDRAIIMRAMMN
ncbi:MAG: proline/glycine betaine ABC transporter ATP-binding protein, partial [Pseudomonadota bacterium]